MYNIKYWQADCRFNDFEPKTSSGSKIGTFAQYQNSVSSSVNKNTCREQFTSYNCTF